MGGISHCQQYSEYYEAVQRPIIDTTIRSNVTTYIDNLSTMVFIMVSISMNVSVTVNIMQHIMGLLTGLNNKE